MIQFAPLPPGYPCNDPLFDKPLPFTVTDWNTKPTFCDVNYCRNLNAFADKWDGQGTCPRPWRGPPVRDLMGVRPPPVF